MFLNVCNNCLFLGVIVGYDSFVFMQIKLPKGSTVTLAIRDITSSYWLISVTFVFPIDTH